jgi:tetratricopeptide (TPR) repeat protein
MDWTVKILIPIAVTVAAGLILLIFTGLGRKAIDRLLRKKGENPPPPAAEDGPQPITVQIPPPPSGTGQVRLTIDYLDGLPQIPDEKRRGDFEKAYALYAEQKYREAIPAFEECFSPQATSRERAALHILIGNCFLNLSRLDEAEGHYREAEALIW